MCMQELSMQWNSLAACSSQFCILSLVVDTYKAIKAEGTVWVHAAEVW